MIENTVEYVATKMAGGRDRQEMRQFRVLLPPLPSKLLNPLQQVIFFASMASLFINIKMTLTMRNEKDEPGLVRNTSQLQTEVEFNQEVFCSGAVEDHRPPRDQVWIHWDPLGPTGIHWDPLGPTLS